MWIPGTWGEQKFTNGCFFSLSATRLVGRCEEWPISCVTDAGGWTELYSGKRGMVQAGGSASRIIGDRSATDPGGGRRVPGGRQPAWQEQVGHVRGSHWTPNPQVFPPLGGNSTTDCGRRERQLPDDIGKGSGSETPRVPISTVGMGGGPMASQGRAVGTHRCGMRPAGAGRPSPQKPIVDLSEVRGNAAARLLSVGVAEFSPALGSRTQGTAGKYSDGGNSHSYSLDSRSWAGRSKVAIPTAAKAEMSFLAIVGR